MKKIYVLQQEIKVLRLLYNQSQADVLRLSLSVEKAKEAMSNATRIAIVKKIARSFIDAPFNAKSIGDYSMMLIEEVEAHHGIVPIN